MISEACKSALTVVWRHDFDGQPYHVTEHDTGHGTAWGVTEATWQDAVADGIVAGALADATQDQCGEVLFRMFWLRAHCDALHPAVALVHFNVAMVCGVRRAALLLQRAAGAAEDGVIGPKTLAAVAATGAAMMVWRLTAREEAFFDGLADAVWFGRGWDARAEAVKWLALERIATKGMVA